MLSLTGGFFKRGMIGFFSQESQVCSSSNSRDAHQLGFSASAFVIHCLLYFTYILWMLISFTSPISLRFLFSI